jgi:hypothetical protein
MMLYKITEPFFIIVAYVLLVVVTVMSWVFIGCIWLFIAGAICVEWIYKKVGRK